MARRLLLAHLAGCFLLTAALAADKAREVPLLTNAYDEFARDLVQMLADLNEQQVSIGEFSPTGFDASSGQGVAHDLAAALEKAKKGVVAPKARYQIKGDMLFVQSEAEPGQRVIQFNFRLIEVRTGKTIDVPKTFRVNGTKEIARIVQPDVRLDDEGTKAQRNRQIQTAVERPGVHVERSKVRTKADSPYAVELVVKNAFGGFDPKPAVARGGQAFCALAKSDVYRVRIHNDSNQEVAVALFVDGINSCHFSKKKKPDGKPAFEHFIVAPNSAQDVVGWFVDATDSAVDYKEFLVTENGKGAASLLPTKARTKVGVVTVSFAHCYEAVPGGRGGAETGVGAPVRVAQKPLKRDIDPPCEFINVRYAR